MKKISIIVLNWNGWKMTVSCLESLLKINHKGFSLDILVVDNGSADKSVEFIENLKFKIENSLKIENLKLKIIKNENNLGFAQGNNIGIKQALEESADYICLLNNDTRVHPDFLSELFKVAESDSSIGIVGGKIYFEKGYEFHKEKYKKDDLGKVIWYAGGIIDWDNVYATHRGMDEVDSGKYETAIETEYVSGCLMLIKKEVFEKIGLLDWKYFLYFEENDFCQKAKRAGFKLYFAPKGVIWHLNAGSSGSGSELHDYYLTRNRLLFGMRWASIRSKINLIRESFNLLINGRNWQKIGVKDFYFGKFGRGSWKG